MSFIYNVFHWGQSIYAIHLPKSIALGQSVTKRTGTKMSSYPINSIDKNKYKIINGMGFSTNKISNFIYITT
jgi:hypothetical protein